MEEIIIETKGKWRKFSEVSGEEFEVGKTYKINVEGDCLFAISANKPTSGFGANSLTYTKQADSDLWIFTL